MSGRDSGKQQEGRWERIYAVVRRIPRGKVATYGQVAAQAGMPSHARFVGRTLRELPDGSRLHWHRVVNASLRISLRTGTNDGGNLQSEVFIQNDALCFRSGSTTE